MSLPSHEGSGLKFDKRIPLCALRDVSPRMRGVD